MSMMMNSIVFEENEKALPLLFGLVEVAVVVVDHQMEVEEEAAAGAEVVEVAAVGTNSTLFCFRPWMSARTYRPPQPSRSGLPRRSGPPLRSGPGLACRMEQPFPLPSLWESLGRQ